MQGTNKRFDNVTIALHWLIGIGIIVVSVAELVRGEWPKGHFVREGLKALHNPVGTVIFALIVFRVAWRFAHRAPTMPVDMLGWEKAAAKLTHIALYVLMLAIPVAGIVYTFARGRPIDFGLFQIAFPLNSAISPAATKSLKSIHEWLGQAVLGVAFLHAVAALWHHYVRKDGVMLRMLPSRNPAAVEVAETVAATHSSGT